MRLKPFEAMTVALLMGLPVAALVTVPFRTPFGIAGHDPNVKLPIRVAQFAPLVAL